MSDIITNEIHVGATIRKYFVDFKIYKSALARTLGVNDSVILAYEKRVSITTATLVNLSHALKHNFFADIAAQLPKTYSNSVLIDNSTIEKIAQLEQEIIILKAEKEILLQAFRK